MRLRRIQGIHLAWKPADVQHNVYIMNAAVNEAAAAGCRRVVAPIGGRAIALGAYVDEAQFADIAALDHRLAAPNRTQKAVVLSDHQGYAAIARSPYKRLGFRDSARNRLFHQDVLGVARCKLGVRKVDIMRREEVRRLNPRIRQRLFIVPEVVDAPEALAVVARLSRVAACEIEFELIPQIVDFGQNRVGVTAAADDT